MKPGIAFAIILVVLTGAGCQNIQETLPLTPTNQIPDYSSDMQVLTEASGDLNGDNLLDKARLYRSPLENRPILNPRPTSIPDRVLVIELQNPDTTFTPVVSSTSAVMCYTCGGLIGDPFKAVRIDKGMLIIEHYGGDYERWGISDTFAWIKDGLYLVRRVRTDEDTHLLVSEKMDYNLLTGKLTSTTNIPPHYDSNPDLSNEDKAIIAHLRKGIKHATFKKQPLIPLQDFNVNEELSE